MPFHNISVEKHTIDLGAVVKDVVFCFVFSKAPYQIPKNTYQSAYTN